MNTKPLLSVFASCLVAACASDRPVAGKAPVAAAGILRSGVYLQNLDTSVRPQDDFYRYVNGTWLTTTSIPSDRSNYGAFSLLEEGAEHHLHEILEEASKSNAAAGSDAQKVGDFYASFMDEASVDTHGLEPLAQEFARIEALRSKKDVAEYAGYSQRLFVAQPFAFFVAIDEKNSSEYVSTVFQTGLGMPDRDYYLSDDERLKGIREKYRVYVKDMLAAAGTPDAAAAAEKIFALESRLAQAHWTRVQNRDAEKTYNRYDLASLGKLMPAFDWSAFLSGARVMPRNPRRGMMPRNPRRGMMPRNPRGMPAEKVKAVIVTQPSYFEALDKAIAEVPVATWRSYFRYKLLNAYAPDLPAKFVRLHFDFNSRAVSGIEELKPRWKRGVDTVENAIGDLAGKMYVERHFSTAAKQRMDALVGNLIAAFSAGIDDLEWMSPQTQQKAHAKLALFTTKIGYPERWRDWSKLEVRRDDLIGNEMRAAAVVFDRGIDKLGGPIDETEWLMTPQSVNAYYYPPANEIVFPAAILQPPFFNVDADDAVNYGAIGAVIGHEISHGFDDQGRRYDGEGNLNDWWAPEDNEEFTRRAQALGAQYNALSPIEGLNVNGDLTMGENIADVAGVAMAYRAYRLSLKGRQAPVIDGFTGEQRFFIGWAQGWARKYREDELRKRLLTDPHSPSEYRTNTVVSNLPAFHDAFQVKPGDRMYKPPQERVRIW